VDVHSLATLLTAGSEYSAHPAKVRQVLSSLLRIFPRRVAGVLNVNVVSEISKGADLYWVIEIPNLENVVMDASNAIAQWMPLKEDTFT
jgi:hypothetical protein